MKKMLLVAVMSMLVLMNSLCVGAQEYDPNFDYAEAMIQAACNGDEASGMEYCRLRRMKMADMGINDNLQFDCLYLLAKVIHTEVGSSWVTEEHRQLVGSVVLNRINSPEFPNTMYEVVYQPYQYGAVTTGVINYITPYEWCVRSAYTLLVNGSIAPSSVVFQAEFPQGSGTYKAVYDSLLGTTYFCYSSHPWMY